MKIRNTIKRMAETPLSETVDLKTLKFLFPYDWKKRLTKHKLQTISEEK